MGIVPPAGQSTGAKKMVITKQDITEIDGSSFLENQYCDICGEAPAVDINGDCYCIHCLIAEYDSQTAVSHGGTLAEV